MTQCRAAGLYWEPHRILTGGSLSALVALVITDHTGSRDCNTATFISAREEHETYPRPAL